MSTIIGACLIGTGFVVLLIILCKPLKEEIPPIDYSLKNSKTVWGLWFTGEKHIELIGKYNSIKRILLMKPDSSAFQKNLEISGGDKEEARKEIKTLTQRAIKQGIKIRWYLDFQMSSLTIYDPLQNDEPTSDRAYCIASKLEPDVPRNKRPLYIIKKKDDVVEFNSRINKFKNLWNNALEPKPEEYDEYEIHDVKG